MEGYKQLCAGKNRSIEGLCDTEEREQAEPVHLFKNHQLKKHT